jgi:CDP-diacylglycerol---glycerol-3-phosphate 3-phosphatidyltransferase
MIGFKMTIANYVTFSRLLISPIFLLLYLKFDSFGIHITVLPYMLLGLLFILEVTDAADGFLARRYHQVTDLGKLLDPMADSISRICIFLTFTVGLIQLPMIIIFVFLYRDSVISTLRTLCALKGFALAARLSGKIKAILQAMASFCVVGLMIPYSLDMIDLELYQTLSTWICGVVALYAALSMIDYFYANRNYIKQMVFSKGE